MNSLSLTSLLVLVPASMAQVGLDEMLVNPSDSDGLCHLSADGTVLLETGPGTGSSFRGAAILPDGRWAVVRALPVPGINIFDPVSGAEVDTFDIASDLTNPGAPTALSNGTLVLTDEYGSLQYYDLSGNLLVNIEGLHYTSVYPVVDNYDHVWMHHWNAFELHKYDKSGNLLDVIPLPVASYHLDIADDGTIWHSLAGDVVHRLPSGGLIDSFDSGMPGILGIELAADDTLWVTGTGSTIRQFDQDGVLLQEQANLCNAPSFYVQFGATLGTSLCSPAVPNSTGEPGRILAVGTHLASSGQIELRASRLPEGVSSLFVGGMTQGLVTNVGGGLGTLCLSGAIARWKNQIGPAVGGEYVGTIDLSSMPLPPSFGHAVSAGETWTFQCWHRDQGSSNLTDAVEVTFR